MKHLRIEHIPPDEGGGGVFGLQEALDSFLKAVIFWISEEMTCLPK